MRVAVIGAGASGLATAREFRDRGHAVQVFEQGERAGGVWAFDPKVEDDLLGLQPSKRIYSSLYDQLRTNLPSDLMAFKGFPFSSAGGGDDDWPRFPHHTSVQKYLMRFIETYQLSPLIRYDAKVTRVVRDERWLVEVESEAPEQFDVVVVCSGHFSQPRVPELSGMESFAGTLLHSHNYRRGEDFHGQKVAVLGKGASGADIVQELLPHAAQVYWCGFGETGRFGDVVTTAFPEQINKRSFTTETDEFPVDSILFCTGYKYEMGFLDRGVIKIENNFVSPLFRDIVAPVEPSLGIIGLPYLVVPFPLYAMQAKWFAASVDGEFTLPPTKLMLEHCAARADQLNNEGVLQRHFHRLGDQQGAYYNLLAAECGAEPLPVWFSNLAKEAQTMRMQHPANFRDMALSTPRQSH